MNNSIVHRIETICDESRAATGKSTFWLTQDKISDDDILQVSAELGENEEYGFLIKSRAGEYRIYFCVHKFKKRLFGLMRPHVMKSKCVASMSINLKNLTETDIEQWFSYASHKFKKKYRPRLLGENNEETDR